MTFLNPAILFGLIALSIPILLHFLNLRKLKRVEFSTLAFLKELQKSKIRRIKIKQWLLLIIRSLIILFLVLAFARPTISTNYFGSSSAAKTSAVFIIDNTFSMSAIDENGSYLNQAKKRAAELLNVFQNGDEVSIITVDQPEKKVSPIAGKESLKKLIDEIEISNVRRSINESIISASQILYESSNYNKEIFVFTDFQSNSLYDNDKELSSLKNVLEPYARIHFIDFSGDPVNNLSVSRFECLNQIFEQGKSIEFSVEVKNNSQNSQSTLTSLFLNGQRKSQQSISLSGGESKSLYFETTLSDTGFVEAFVEIEDDAIINDNRRFVSFLSPATMKILLVYDNQSDAHFVELALRSGSKGLVSLTSISHQQIVSTNPTNFDAIFLVGTKNFNPSNRINQYLERGGTLIVFPGTSEENNLYPNIPQLKPFVKNAVLIDKSNNKMEQLQFGKTNIDHPLFNDLFESKESREFETPSFIRYFNYSLVSDVDKIISLSDGAPFLSFLPLNKGRVFVFNTAPVLGWSDFPLKGVFAPLMNRLIFYSASKNSKHTDLFCGNSVVLDISQKLTSQVKVDAPQNNYFIINTDSLANQNYLLFDKTFLPGSYKLLSYNKLLDFSVVNPHPLESEADKYGTDKIIEYFEIISFDGSVFIHSAEDNLNTEVYDSRFGTELWKYFVIFALILALLEMYLSKSSKNDLSNLEK
ncbi:MAG: BatA and WFA domain-containing protein [Melioribacteraceae bacterium]|nr:BatA and WFA domain-containing protein [Melioribacteraceae bacterium]